MSSFLFAITAAFHLLIPIGSAAILAWRPARSRISRTLGLLAVLSYTGFLFLAGAGWGMLGQGPRFGVVIVVVALSTVAGVRARSAPTRPRGAWAWAMAATATLAALLTLSPYPSLAGARTTDSPQVELQLPLEQGRYIVIHGGANATVNQHALVPAQRYALDILAIDAWGFRASGMMPHELSRYAIFGRRVVAPCDGTILAERQDLADLPPLESDRSAPAGNHVLLHCPERNVTVLLAHLQHDSLTASPGDSVSAGQVLGCVGNSGNTSEPHLHIHAVRGHVTSIDEAIRTAEPMEMRFGQRALVRNDIFESAIAAQDRAAP